MTPASILALVVVLNTAATSTEITVATLPEQDCLSAMRAIWSVPAKTVATDPEGWPVPAVDAYCALPGELAHD